jgi:uncharacterized membrane protein
MEWVLLALIVFGITFVLPIASWVSIQSLRRRIADLERTVEDQARSLELLKKRPTAAEPAAAAAATPRPAPASPPASPPRPSPPPAPAPHLPPPPPVPVTSSTPAAPTERPWPDLPPPPPKPPAPAKPAVVENPWPERTQPAAIPPAAAVATPSASVTPAAAASTPPPAAASVTTPPAPPRRPPPPPPPPPTREPFDWEQLVGVKLFSGIAGIALLLAAIFFLRYSVQQGWLQPPVRVAIGIVVAIGLLIACELKAARRYPSTANALDASAIAILFATFFSAHALWHLIPAGVAFGLLALVTVVAVTLSIRRESLFIAVLGLLGGFATPALLSTGENRPIPLFAYLLLLNVGLAWVSYRQVWPVLSWLTVILTAIYQWGWVIKFLTVGQLSLAMGIFLLFPLVTIGGLVLGSRAETPAARAASASFERTALIASALPLFFAVYLAVVPGYAGHPWLLLSFLSALDAGLLAVSIARRQDLLAAAAAVATLLVMTALLWTGYSIAARLPIVAFTAVFTLLFTFAPMLAAAFERPFDALGERSAYAGPLLLFVFAVVVRIDPRFASPWLPMGVLLVLIVAIAVRAALSERGGLYFVAAFFGIAAQASWSATFLDVPRLGTAVALYTAFGAVTLAAPILARRAGRAFAPAAGTGLVVLASLPLLLFFAAGPVAPAALWALALLLAILNAAMFIESAAVGLPPISFVGSLFSWAILAAWWLQASGSVGILASLSVLAGMTLVTLGGYAWAHQRPRGGAPASVSSRFRDGMFLGLTGHLFLLLLALNPAWSVPPWPLFGTLAVLTLATSVASLAVRAGALHIAGVAAAALVVLAWTLEAAGTSWGLVALLAAGAVSAFAAAWLGIAERRDLAAAGAAAAAAALFVAEGTAMAASGVPAAPFAAIVIAHVVNLSGILTLTWRRRWRHVALAAAAVAWAAALQWQGALLPGTSWLRLLVLGGAMYAVFIVYPVLLGRRVQDERDPHVAAVVASAMFFFAARAALEAGHRSYMVGLVPVLESAVLAGLLRQLLALERPGARDLGRLAIVAGAALAFVTVAIPLQLRHQWITIGWALEGAALAWLFRRIPHRGLFYSALGLLTAVFVRLALNPAIFEYEPRGSLRIFNWYLYTYVLCSAAMLLAAWWMSSTDDTVIGAARASSLLPAAAGVLLFLVLNIEIADYFATGPEITFRFGAGVSQDLTYTIGWLIFGMALLGVGIWQRSHAARVAAVMLIAVTTFKCFLYDLRSLEGLYRVGSFVGLAIALALVSLALQKFVLARPEGGS